MNTGPDDHWPLNAPALSRKLQTLDFINSVSVWTLLKVTFFTGVFIFSVNEKVARTLGEPWQDDELQDSRDTSGGQQDGPVLFSTQKLSVDSHNMQRFRVTRWLLSSSCPRRAEDDAVKRWQHLLEADDLSD